MKAYNFELPDQEGTTRNLVEYKGKWIVLYFYPKDNTPGCTKEACSFRDSYHQLQGMGVQIIGISKDSVSSHKKFAEKFSLNFPILSDVELIAIKKYGAWGKKKFMGREFEGTLRNTYLIDPQGNLIKTYEKVNPLFHASEIIADIKKLKNNAI